MSGTLGDDERLGLAHLRKRLLGNVLASQISASGDGKGQKDYHRQPSSFLLLTAPSKDIGNAGKGAQSYYRRT